MTSLLEIKHLGCSFEIEGQASREIIKDFNFTMQKGDFVSVVGSNGAGKSTLFNLLAGNLTPTSGKIQINGQDVTKQNARQRAKLISRVFQDPNLGTAGDLSVLANLVLAQNRGKVLNLKPYRNKKQREIYLKKLSALELQLEERLEQPIERLSGGQRQAVSLLMATIERPELLLLDEHTAALDPKTSQLIMSLTDKMVREEQLTTLMITHDLGDALKYGNRLIMLHQGQVVLDLTEAEKEKLSVEELLHLFLQKSGTAMLA